MKYLYIVIFLFTHMLILMHPAHSSEIGVITGSKHFDSDTQYNESNPGLYVTSKGYTVGAYKNSYSSPTIYAGLISTWTPHKRVKLSLAYGVSHGYGWDNGLADPAVHGAKVLLFILPTLSIKHDSGFYLNTHIVGNAVAWSISREW